LKDLAAMRFFLLGPANLLALALAYLGARTVPGNLMGAILILFGLSFVIGGTIVFWPGKTGIIGRMDGQTRGETGDRSFWLILPGFLVIFYAAPLEHLLTGKTAGLAWQIAGWIIFIAGVGLYSWSRRSLKGAYTGHIQVRAEQSLCVSGPYRWIRHPAYAGFLGMGLGLAAGYTSIIAGLAVPLLLLPGLVYRMRVEERFLVEQFENDYKDYAARTRRLIPGLW
jgi:protein-S-isoprenylcysteine O-methyltransferase Ste14